MATYYDGLNNFFKFNEQDPLQTSAQLVYLHLLQLNNRSGNSGRVQVSDRTLEHLTSLNKNTITQAKRTLKNLGLIDFKTDSSKPRQGTTYTIIFFIQIPIQKLGQKVGQSSEIPIIRVREDEEDVKTKNSAATRERVGLEEILEEWENNHGRPLSIEEQSQMQAWAQRYGEEWLKGLFPKAWEKCTARAMCFAYIKGYISREIKGGISPKTKGGEENGGYKLPKRTGGEEWAKY